MSAIEHLKFPIGSFTWNEQTGFLPGWIDEIEAMPANLRGAIQHLSADQLGTPYRPDGWTVRQVVHHLADSHMNAYIRMKMAVTESKPTIKPYAEDLWADLADYKTDPVVSLNLLDALTHRWVVLLRSLTDVQLQTCYYNHPDSGLTRLDQAIGTYAWHSNHHLAHVTNLMERMGWS